MWPHRRREGVGMLLKRGSETDIAAITINGDEGALRPKEPSHNPLPSRDGRNEVMQGGWAGE